MMDIGYPNGSEEFLFDLIQPNSINKFKKRRTKMILNITNPCIAWRLDF